VEVLRRTKIVATVGPACRSAEGMAALAQAGMDVARINLSHVRSGELRELLATFAQVREGVSRPLGLMLDTRGPEVRTGPGPGPAELKAGGTFILTEREVPTTATAAHVNLPDLPQRVRPGQTALIDDGNLVLTVTEVAADEVRCRVEAGGTLLPGKKVELPGVDLGLPILTADDERDLREGLAAGADFVAVSFVNGPDDVVTVRRFCERMGAATWLIAKIETGRGVAALDGILKVADGIMVARGDLGLEMRTADVPIIQKDLIRRALAVGKPTITATQMLESMIEHPRPTRAEASDVANAILDGSDAVMLSAETAMGCDPPRVVRTMAEIAERADEELARQGGVRSASPPRRPVSVTQAVSQASCELAADLGAAAIITPSESGHTARMVARHRPATPVVAVTSRPEVLRRLTLVWGVTPLLVSRAASSDAMIAAALGRALEAGAVGSGDLVVLTAGVPVGVPGTTNMVQVHTIGDVLVRGTGVGSRPATGRVRVVRGASDAAASFRDGDVLVAAATDRDLVPYMQRAAAIVCEEEGLTSHAAVVGVTLGIPVVVGASGATERLPPGETVTVDPARGLVYRGQVHVL
jgi:pyruvate kinase